MEPMIIAIKITTMILVICAIAAVVIVVCAKLLHKLLASHDEASSGEEAKLLQNINAKVNRLEKRIETLESIVTSPDSQHE